MTIMPASAGRQNPAYRSASFFLTDLLTGRWPARSAARLRGAARRDRPGADPADGSLATRHARGIGSARFGPVGAPPAHAGSADASASPDGARATHLNIAL